MVAAIAFRAAQRTFERTISTGGPSPIETGALIRYALAIDHSLARETFSAPVGAMIRTI